MNFPAYFNVAKTDSKFTFKEVLEILDISEYELRELVKTGKLQPQNLKRDWKTIQLTMKGYWSKQQLLDFLRENPKYLT